MSIYPKFGLFSFQLFYIFKKGVFLFPFEEPASCGRNSKCYSIKKKGFLLNVSARASVMFFLEYVLFCFSRSFKAIKKAMSQVRTIVCFRRRSSTILFGFAFDFLQFATVKSLKISTICEICPPDHLKAEKIGVTEEVSSLFVIFCLLPLSQI